MKSGKFLLFALAALTVILAGCKKEIDPTSVRLDQHELTIHVGETTTLVATIAPANATNTALGWTSAQPTVATVDKGGKVTALSEGQASIIVTTLAGGFTDACIVTVIKKPIAVTGVKLDKNELEITEGDTYQLIATVEPSNATNQAVTFSSSDDEVATVDNLGYVRAQNAGKTTVTVKTEDGSFSASCEVTVLKYTIPVLGVWVLPEEMTLEKGASATLQWSIDPLTATDKSVTFTSSDTNVATVSEEGVVTAVDYGEATVTITTVDGGFTDECKVTVAALVEGVTITPATVELAEGQTVQLSASVSPAGAPQEVEWVSSDKNIATVDENGLVTAVAAGTAKIAARSTEYHDKQGFCEVTVTLDNSLKGISLSPTELTLTVGQSQTLTVIYTPEHAANKKVSWSSSNGDVATVSAEGKVVALTEGTATITATSEEGGFTAGCAVTVSKEAGAKVYYTRYYDNPRILYVNGVQDPLNGAFDQDTDSLRSYFEGVDALCSDGSDLYSIETYYEAGLDENGQLVYSKDVRYLCKNRKPLHIVDLKYYYHTIEGMTVRNGKVALVISGDAGKDNYFIIVSPDGTSTRCDLTGSIRTVLDGRMYCAFTPDENLYISAYIQDYFYANYLALYRYEPDGTLTEKLLKNGNDSVIPIIGTSNSESIYVLGREFNNDKHFDEITLINQNGDVISTIPSDWPFDWAAFRMVDDHIYTATYNYKEQIAEERRDGQVLRTYDIGSDSYCQQKNPFFITSSGDSYLGMNHHVYKNGSVLYSIPDDFLIAFCVVE